MAQTILDVFPDFVSDYGLVGCGVSLLAVSWLGFVSWIVIRR